VCAEQEHSTLTTALENTAAELAAERTAAAPAGQPPPPPPGDAHALTAEVAMLRRVPLRRRHMLASGVCVCVCVQHHRWRHAVVALG